MGSGIIGSENELFSVFLLFHLFGVVGLEEVELRLCPRWIWMWGQGELD